MKGFLKKSLALIAAIAMVCSMYVLPAAAEDEPEPTVVNVQNWDALLNHENHYAEKDEETGVTTITIPKNTIIETGGFSFGSNYAGGTVVFQGGGTIRPTGSQIFWMNYAPGTFIFKDITLDGHTDVTGKTSVRGINLMMQQDLQIVIEEGCTFKNFYNTGGGSCIYYDSSTSRDGVERGGITIKGGTFENNTGGCIYVNAGVEGKFPVAITGGTFKNNKGLNSTSNGAGCAGITLLGKNASGTKDRRIMLTLENAKFESNTTAQEGILGANDLLIQGGNLNMRTTIQSIKNVTFSNSASENEADKYKDVCIAPNGTSNNLNLTVDQEPISISSDL